ncbi:FAR-17a/AIG1-like protein [Clohesyomyces aquaticus]|uniref:FAR-17a/AIG1-like protein n=1 Tax=Clohesyomyces aquaticus TaxID=1231657 RepID=A0A1Y1ZH20_9PLEO|nr:FAR-17a/AIG1-like protein [Clohesyomyces aquaticus]
MSASKMVEKLSRRHPLQRLESPSKGFSGVVHVFGLLIFYSDFKYLRDHPNFINDSYGWHLQYLTIIGLALSTLCFLSGLASDITSSPTLFLLKNYLSLLAAPLEILISLLYWTLLSISPSLVIPTTLPPLPLLNDLSFHLLPSLLLTLDTLLLSPPWPTAPMNPAAPVITLVTSSVLSFAYWIWIEVCYAHNGFYPYPIFGLLDTWQRVGLFAFSGGMMCLVGAGLRAAYRLVNGMEGVGEMDAEKKRE